MVLVRAVGAVFLAAVLVLMASAPHVHTAAHGDHDCPACLARNVEAARMEVPDLVPSLVEQQVEVVELVSIAPAGSPLGAVPGQSPPVSA